jgi:6-phosphogluconolactonase (cycloisomerase 2 family)
MPNGTTDGAVYVQTNETKNQVVVFRRSADGTLSPGPTYDTGGAGDGVPHLTSQGSVTLSSDGGFLITTNVASHDVSVFRAGAGGELLLLGRSPAGPSPKSVTEHGGLVYVLATGGPSVAGFRLGQHGLEPIAGAEQMLSPDADPAQVGFTPDGSAVIVTERGRNSISAIAVGSDGAPGRTRTVASSGPTPYGFAITAGGTLVVTEAFRAQKGAAAASSYSVVGTGVTPITRSAGNGRSEICWAVVTGDGRFAFTTNFADGAVSRYSIADDGRLDLGDATAAVSLDGRPGLRDEALSADGRFLYAIDADSGTVFGWAVGEDGTLSPVGSWGGLPTTVAGMAAT